MNYYPQIIEDILKFNGEINGEQKNVKLTYDPQRNLVFNSTGGYIFKLIKDGNDFNSIVSILLNKYKIDENGIDKIRKEVLNVLYQFYILGFLRWKDGVNPFEQQMSRVDGNLKVKFCWLDDISVVKDNTEEYTNPIIDESKELQEQYILQSIYMNKEFIIELFCNEKNIGYFYISTKDANTAFIIKKLSIDFDSITKNEFEILMQLVSQYIYSNEPYKSKRPEYFNLFINLATKSYPFDYLKQNGFNYLGDIRYESCLNEFTTYQYQIRCKGGEKNG
ncbi:MAG: PqqD family protein [Bacilli bacterium]